MITINIEKEILEHLSLLELFSLGLGTDNVVISNVYSAISGFLSNVNTSIEKIDVFKIKEKELAIYGLGVIIKDKIKELNKRLLEFGADYYDEEDVQKRMIEVSDLLLYYISKSN